MTDDIVKRLRAWAECEDDILIEAACADFHVAADEIERLRARIAALEEALRTIAAMDGVSVTDYDDQAGWNFQCVARAALNNSTEEK